MTIRSSLRTGLLAAFAAALCSCSGGTGELFAAKKEKSRDRVPSRLPAGTVDAKDIVGQLQDHQIASLSGRKITGQLAGSLIDWRGLADDSIYGESIRSIRGDKITGTIDAAKVNWGSKKTYKIRIAADSITEGTLALERMPSSLPFALMSFKKEDVLPAANLPEVPLAKLPSIPAAKIDGVLAAAQLPPLTAEQLPELSAIKGLLPAARIAGPLKQAQLERVPAGSLMFHPAPGRKQSWGKGKISNAVKGIDGETLDSVAGDYYWFRVGKMVTLQFALDREGSGKTPIKISMPVGDVPLPTQTMFTNCRKLSGTEFLDYAFGTSTIWPSDAVTARSQPLVLSTTGAPNCPLPDDTGKKSFQLWAPEFPANSRVSGTITYIADPNAEPSAETSAETSAEPSAETSAETSAEPGAEPSSERAAAYD